MRINIFYIKYAFNSVKQIIAKLLFYELFCFGPTWSEVKKGGTRKHIIQVPPYLFLSYNSIKIAIF